MRGSFWSSLGILGLAGPLEGIRYLLGHNIFGASSKTMAFAIWGSNLSGKRLIIHADNEALVSILNFNTSKFKRVMYLLRNLVLQGLRLNIQCKAKLSI